MVQFSEYVRKLAADKEKALAAAQEPENRLPSEFGESALIRFYDAKNEEIGDEILVPLSATKDDLTELLRSGLAAAAVNGEINGEEISAGGYALVLPDLGVEISKSLRSSFEDALKKGEDSSLASSLISTEKTLRVSFYAVSQFRVRPVTRLSGSLSGHNGTVVCCAFSPDSTMLASGSGDGNVRLWDLLTATPQAVFSGHKGCVECISWSPLCDLLASGGEDATVRIWNPQASGTSNTATTVLTGHRATITSMAFMPAHFHHVWKERGSGRPPLLTAARDGSIRVWNVVLKTTIVALDGHSAMCSAVRWSGFSSYRKDDGSYTTEGGGPFIYSSGRDMTMKVWDSSDGRLIRAVRSHGHWVNSFSTNTEWTMRMGPYDPRMRKGETGEALTDAVIKWKAFAKDLGYERLVTCSDDNCLALWNLLESDKRVTLMTGHQKGVVHVSFSPDGRYIASAAFDSSIRLWDGRDGKYLAVYRGHCGPVYQVAWAADSTLFVSGSKDSTLKVWDVTEGKRRLKEDLPGHADEIYAIDWSPDGSRVASGGKDKMVRLWAH